jgi:hypothetical protein
MAAHQYPYLLTIGLVILGWSLRICAAETDASAPAPVTATASATTTGTTVAHKSSHRKKKKSAVASTTATGKKTPATTTTAGAKGTLGTKTGTTAASATSTATGVKTAATGKTSKTKKKSRTRTAHAAPAPAVHETAVAPAPSVSVPSSPAIIPVTPSAAPAGAAPVTVTKSNGGTGTQITISAPTDAPHAAAGPEVDTGLPVARPGSAEATPHGTGSYQVASTFPVSPLISSMGSYSPPERAKTSLDNFVFTNFSRRVRNVYPWKLDIITTEFWIGEGGSSISPTDNIESAWDTNWRANNHGTDNPNDRDGYLPGGHIAMTNPFYVALPFNDLAFPDKARRWLPAGWYRPPREGKQVSACKDRWVEIKNAQGETCYAQWEDVGPLRYDHAEYVFGDERPDTYTRAGLDVSPAVADYLNINGRNRLTRWRFVDDTDVKPGLWLKYDEEALIFKAMHELKDDPTRVLPIQRATAPIDDETDVDANKKRLGAAKG